MKNPPPELAERLVDATPQILRLGGDVKFDEVAEIVETPRATLYYYFSGRDDLIAFLLDSHLRAGRSVVDDAIASGSDPNQQLHNVVVAVASFLSDQPGVCASLLSVMGSGEEFSAVMAANDRVIATPIRQILDSGRSDGTFAISNAADSANVILGGILIAVLGRALAGPPSDDQTFVHGLADQLINGVLGSPSS